MRAWSACRARPRKGRVSRLNPLPQKGRPSNRRARTARFGGKSGPKRLTGPDSPLATALCVGRRTAQHSPSAVHRRSKPPRTAHSGPFARSSPLAGVCVALASAAVLQRQRTELWGVGVRGWCQKSGSLREALASLSVTRFHFRPRRVRGAALWSPLCAEATGIRWGWRVSRRRSGGRPCCWRGTRLRRPRGSSPTS